jgi:hypothetical protein
MGLSDTFWVHWRTGNRSWANLRDLFCEKRKATIHHFHLYTLCVKLCTLCILYHGPIAIHFLNYGLGYLLRRRLTAVYLHCCKFDTPPVAKHTMFDLLLL